MALGTSPSDVDRHHSIIIPLRIHISVQNIFFFILLPDPALHHAAVLQQLMEVITQVLTTRTSSQPAIQSITEAAPGCTPHRISTGTGSRLSCTGCANGSRGSMRGQRASSDRKTAIASDPCSRLRRSNKRLV
ncbi:hypothetical protein M431DRAFT_384533 [Trichoderma harzianum CBS 226.95]|uniref:Uncharacterized protein n=1 Tax=Trichoderma harzianum CBS 226.95 TaxID=983964 RepID=A0A2T4AI22_TRIHA|nr:hypothetical protein M431DRAFT_384533 [Trichoderma harzianum CBS 226.95]PTB56682.1 hypothetical protein M431DRAFT_384533 [Trichoderma harzianum CBS 226.95]